MSVPNTRVLVVDDDEDFREGIVALLATKPLIEVVDAVANGREAIMAVRAYAPDIVLMDINMPEFDGLAATRFIAQVAPAARIIAVSVHTGRDWVRSMFVAGASAYVAKTRARDDVPAAVLAVAAEQLFLSPNLDASVLSEGD